MDQLDAFAGFRRLGNEFVHLVFRLLDEFHIQMIAGFLRVDRQWVDLCFHQVLKEMSPVGWLGAEAALRGHFHQGARVEDIGIA